MEVSRESGNTGGRPYPSEGSIRERGCRRACLDDGVSDLKDSRRSRDVRQRGLYGRAQSRHLERRGRRKRGGRLHAYGPRGFDPDCSERVSVNSTCRGEDAVICLALIDLFDGRNPFDAVGRSVRLNEMQLGPRDRLTQTKRLTGTRL